MCRFASKSFWTAVPGLVLIMATGLYSQLYTTSTIRYQAYDSSISYYESQLQEVQLSDVSIEVKPRGSYLEITEHATIKSVATPPANAVRTYIQGYLKTPQKSTITGFSIVTDSAAYVARLQPDDKIDTAMDPNRGNLMATIRYATLQTDWEYDPNTFLYTSRTVQVFTTMIENVVKGKDYSVIITYLVPNNGRPGATYNLSVLHHCAALKPGIFEFTFSADSSSLVYTLSMNNMNFQLKSGQSIQIPYQQYFQITAKDAPPSTMQLTDFSEGAWVGKYLLLNTTIPDSVMKQLSKPTEMVVLWRWNNPESFMERIVENGVTYSKIISGYGYQVVEQASAIKSLFSDVTDAGSKVGLVHSISKKKDEVFALCRAQSSQLSRIESYLAQFDYQYLEKSSYYHDVDWNDTSSGSSASVDTSGREFVTSIKIVQGLYSNEAGVLRHLIILSCGPIAPSRNFITLEEVDALFKNTTVDCGNAVWTDINMADVKLRSKQDELIGFGQFLVPQFKPHSLMLSVENVAKTYSFPISPNQESFSIIAKSTGAWNPSISWTAYNVSGEIMSTVKSSVKVLHLVNDTGLVKLWAANNERLNDKKESDIDRNYGVVSQSYSLKVFPSYKQYGTDVPIFAAFDPVYAPNFAVPVFAAAPADKTGSAASRFMCLLTGNGIRIVLPGNAPAKKIMLFSLSGRLLLEIAPDRFFSRGEYLIPATYMRSYITAKSAVIMRVESVQGCWNRQMVLR